MLAYKKKEIVMPPFKYIYWLIQPKTPGKHKIDYEQQLHDLIWYTSDDLCLISLVTIE